MRVPTSLPSRLLLGLVMAIAALATACASTSSTARESDPSPDRSGSVLTGLGDPEPDPATAPLEIVLEGCTLNRDRVEPGTHEVALVGSGSVSFVASDGSTLATLTAPGEVTTADDDYSVRCRSGSAAATTRLASRS